MGIMARWGGERTTRRIASLRTRLRLRVVPHGGVSPTKYRIIKGQAWGEHIWIWHRIQLSHSTMTRPQRRCVYVNGVGIEAGLSKIRIWSVMRSLPSAPLNGLSATARPGEWTIVASRSGSRRCRCRPKTARCRAGLKRIRAGDRFLDGGQWGHARAATAQATVVAEHVEIIRERLIVDHDRREMRNRSFISRRPRRTGAAVNGYSDDYWIMPGKREETRHQPQACMHVKHESAGVRNRSRRGRRITLSARRQARSDKHRRCAEGGVDVIGCGSSAGPIKKDRRPPSGTNGRETVRLLPSGCTATCGAPA